MVGKTISSPAIVCKEYDLNLNIEALEKTYEEKLISVFKMKTSDVEEKVETVLYDNKSVLSPAIKVAKPRVVIPVFPGNNCEYDCARAFEKEGAEVTQVVFRNITKEALTESIERLAKEISNSQILMIPGGFSAGDEPDGSGKFIANALRNEKISNAVMELLKNRDGLAIGICNGFQALIKVRISAIRRNSRYKRRYGNINL